MDASKPGCAADPPCSSGEARPRLPAEAPGKLDWHNQRVAFQVALGQALAAAPDDRAREALLKALTATLDSRS